MDAVAQVQLVVRLTLGLIFFISAVAKLCDPAAFARSVVDYRVLPGPTALAYGWVLPFVELGTALLFLTGVFPPIAAGLAALMLTSFMIATTVMVAQGRKPGCHCLGTASDDDVTAWYVLARELLLLVPTLWLAFTEDLAYFVPLTWNTTGIFSFTFAALLSLTYIALIEAAKMIVRLSKRPQQYHGLH